MPDVSEVEKKVYDAEDIQRLLGIGKSKVYTFLDEVYKNNGKLFRVPRKSFDDWLSGQF